MRGAKKAMRVQISGGRKTGVEEVVDIVGFIR
jgi:hypothetical protein